MSVIEEDDSRLKYQPFQSILQPGFWKQLTTVKINQLKLEKGPIDIKGSYASNLASTLPSLASFDHAAFNTTVGPRSAKYSSTLYGELICTNLMQEFIDFDKNQYLRTLGLKIWTAICDGSALTDPESNLSKFGLIVFGDLKKYKFVYWFCFPAINYPFNVRLLASSRGSSASSQQNDMITDHFSLDALRELESLLDDPVKPEHFSKSFFIVKLIKFKDSTVPRVVIYPLNKYAEASKSCDQELDSKLYFAFNDPSHNQNFPGWPLRNFLCLIVIQLKLVRVRLIRLRFEEQNTSTQLRIHHSMVLQVQIEPEPFSVSSMPQISGWERNHNQQLAPKQVNLSKLLDPVKLAEESVNLNLRLMKWRLLPTLDLDKITATRCLILGCGTLGCHIARGLLAWGINNLTLVDNARVSHSNPVRQSLYNYDDCTNPEGNYKAQAAARSLKRIHPVANVQSHVFSIPMPGHPVSGKEVDQVRGEVALLEDLIDSHDAIFLLMDTRESRWLPTVISISKRKLVINAAIGFDTFLLQRYGVRSCTDLKLADEKFDNAMNKLSTSDECYKPTRNQLLSRELGCYFCNDIVAPGNSTQDRTLDQQCTVSRPGVSMLVSALAVELLASVMSSRNGIDTPAPLDTNNEVTNSNDSEFDSELGIVPHTVRGDLSRYHIYTPSCPKFGNCSGCSQPVLKAYRDMGFDFLIKVFDDSNYLESVAGLKDLQDVSDNVLTLDSDDEVGDMDLISDVCE